MSKDFTVVKHGVDTSGRAIYMTRYMQDWWEAYCDALGFAPTIVQGAFMSRNGGGARASAGYHDLGGCLDLRVWDKTDAQVGRMVRIGRRMAAATYVRDAKHGGMDPHLHLILGPDSPIAAGAKAQWDGWNGYLLGRNGLASNGADYHWRPDPLVTDWEPAGPAKTPNITRALRTRDAGIRRNMLNRVVRFGKPKARRAAKAYLAAMNLQETAAGKARVARARLRKEEVR